MDDMNSVHDPSALLALDALLETRSVTLAARRMGVSQSAMSHTLARLRARFEDPLLVRSGRGLVPTARAERMGRHLRSAASELAAAVAVAPAFDPLTARRVFRIATTDLVEMSLLPRVLAILEREAPGIDLHVRAQTDAEPALHSGEIDVAIQPVRDQPSAGLRARALFHEKFVCVMRRGHPLAASKLSAARFAGARHVLVAPRGSPGGIVDDVLTARGLARRTVVLVPSFLAVPHLLAGSDLIATLAERVARAFADLLPLHVVPHPLRLPGFTISTIWHERADADPGHVWLRQALTRAATALP